MTTITSYEHQCRRALAGDFVTSIVKQNDQQNVYNPSSPIIFLITNGTTQSEDYSPITLSSHPGHRAPAGRINHPPYTGLRAGPPTNTWSLGDPAPNKEGAGLPNVCSPEAARTMQLTSLGEDLQPN